MVRAPQLHMVERTLLRVRFTLSLRLPAYGTKESTPSSKDSLSPAHIIALPVLALALPSPQYSFM